MTEFELDLGEIAEAIEGLEMEARQAWDISSALDGADDTGSEHWADLAHALEEARDAFATILAYYSTDETAEA